jgi:hypothetical protein
LRLGGFACDLGGTFVHSSDLPAWAGTRYSIFSVP